MKIHLQAAEILADLLENKFSFLGVRFGFSAIIELIPGIGDILDLLLSSYIVWIAIRMQLPKLKIIQMIVNILFNFIIGIIPVFGDVGYIFNKANIKNLNILKEHLRLQNYHVIEGEIVK